MTKTVQHRGVALITAMWVSLILMILGFTFMDFISNDYFYSGVLQNETAALYLAKACRFYDNAGGNGNSPPLPATNTLYIPDAMHKCSYATVNGLNVYTGTVTNGFTTIATRRIIYHGAHWWIDRR